MSTMPTVARLAERVRENVGRVMVGNAPAIELLLVAALSKGHVLLEDVPGVGKTLLARSTARSFDLSFRRIQFTPDLLPGDITGFSMFQQATGEFAFRPGPVMAQLVLADEINRASPRTQSALLEAMEERRVTVEGVSHDLPQPFLVLATQNPLEFDGTFPLPEAQLDRFLMRVALGYPSREDERTMLRRFRDGDPLHELSAVASADDLEAAARDVRQVLVHPVIEDYILDLAAASRVHDDVQVGASPRATLSLTRASQAMAATRGRSFVTPDDVQVLASPVLAHRMVLTGAAQVHDRSVHDVLDEMIRAVAVPVEENWNRA